MRKLKLFNSSVFQGDFSPAEINLLFVFQVNCPGCFLFGFPLVNDLYAKYAEKPEVKILGLSTAFEDFDFNNEKNTRALLNDGIIVGETLKALAEIGYDEYPHKILFPVAMDELTSGKELTNEENIEYICNINPEFSIWAPYDQDSLRIKVKNYLEEQNLTSATFTLNQMMGTPTFIIFNDRYEILEQWFGHKEYDEIVKMIEIRLSMLFL